MTREGSKYAVVTEVRWDTRTLTGRNKNKNKIRRPGLDDRNERGWVRREKGWGIETKREKYEINQIGGKKSHTRPQLDN